MIRSMRTAIAAFALIAGPGCAGALQNTNTRNCMETDQHAVSVPLLFSEASRKDTYNENCATARAAETIMQIQRADGTPDMEMVTLAVNMYRRSNPEVKKFIDDMLKNEMNGMTINNLQFMVLKYREAKDPIHCERVVETDPETGKKDAVFRCNQLQGF